MCPCTGHRKTETSTAVLHFGLLLDIASASCCSAQHLSHSGQASLHQPHAESPTPLTGSLPQTPTVHCQVLGSLTTAWYEVGATKFDFATTKALLVVQLLLMGSYMDFINPGSQAREGSFFCIEAALESLEPGPELLPGSNLISFVEFSDASIKSISLTSCFSMILPADDCPPPP
ncbi:hypothetical protein Cgig2_020235 [Carnegiea gigantea]|uniref:Uncharacterized protein n=1 Tax=Carnegiea gigantea TaxID=171969 RepID=A0A9Q1QPN3_9CARY|nr:hypothetical protein Cgig2_020235 [Carnegiea gigantea]